MTTPSPAEAIAKVLAQHDGGVIIPSREDAHKEEPATAYGWRCECGKADSYDPPRTWAEAKADLRQHEVDAILSAAERAIRAQVAAEIRAETQTGKQGPGGEDPHDAWTVAELAARIAEGGQTP